MIIQTLGSSGMLGKAVCRAVVARGHAGVVWCGDIGDPLIDAQADVVINCAGLVKGRTGASRRREISDAEFMRVNGYAPHVLAEACEEVGARLIQVSTDCVFDRPGPHSETSMPHGDDIYARSKMAGEVRRPPHLTVRTSFVGWGRRGLLAELVQASEYQASPYAKWSGHTVDTVAEVLVVLAERPDITGLLHVPGEFSTRLDLARALAGRYDLPVHIVGVPRYASDRRLVSDRWRALGLPMLPPFYEQLERMVRP